MSARLHAVPTFKCAKQLQEKKGVLISFVANGINSLLVEFISLCFEPLKSTQNDDLIRSGPTEAFTVLINESGYNTFNQSEGRSIMLFDMIV